MKKLFLIVLAVALVMPVMAQRQRKNKVSLQYGLEIIGNGDANSGTYKVDSFKGSKGALGYRCYMLGGFFIEPQVAYYVMDFDYWKDTGNGLSANPDLSGIDKYRYGNSILDEKGIGVSAAVGYNILLGQKVGIEIFVQPDYRSALECLGEGGADLIDEGLFQKDYFIFAGGIGVNYGALGVNFTCGSYMTSRYLKNEDAQKPLCVGVGIGFKF